MESIRYIFSIIVVFAMGYFLWHFSDFLYEAFGGLTLLLIGSTYGALSILFIMGVGEQNREYDYVLDKAREEALLNEIEDKNETIRMLGRKVEQLRKAYLEDLEVV